MNEKAAVPFTASSTTSSGVPGEMTPAIGPTAPREWHGLKAISPEPASALGVLGRARPALEEDRRPSTAPRIGPHIRSQPIGGPGVQEASAR